MKLKDIFIILALGVLDLPIMDNTRRSLQQHFNRFGMRDHARMLRNDRDDLIDKQETLHLFSERLAWRVDGCHRYSDVVGSIIHVYQTVFADYDITLQEYCDYINKNHASLPGNASMKANIKQYVEDGAFTQAAIEWNRQKVWGMDENPYLHS